MTTAIRVRYQATQDNQITGTWRAEAHGDGGALLSALFTGPNAEIRCRDYVRLANGELDTADVAGLATRAQTVQPITSPLPG